MHKLIADRRVVIAEICRRYHVRRLEVFGSGARGDDFDPAESDVDFIVDFDPDVAPPTLAIFFAFRADLAALLGRSVDLVTADTIRNPYLRATIDAVREPVYAA